MSKQSKQVIVSLGNTDVPVTHRSDMLMEILAGAKNDEAASKEVAEEIFQKLQGASASEETQAKAKWLSEVITQLQNSPLKPATFIQMTQIEGGSVPHAMVSLDSGELVYIVCHDHGMTKKLRLGDRIMVDANMKILISPALNELHFGSESRLERMVDKRHLEVVTHQDDRMVVLAGPELMEQIERGEVPAGSSIVIGAGNRIGIYAVPAKDKMQFRFLDRSPVPNILVGRDIGSPPKIIEQVDKHIREEMTRPELRRKFRLRPCITRLLCGVSGTGKTLARMAIHRRMYEIMSEITGTPIEKLPSRVFVFKTSQMLSMWLGESDKNIDRLFDEVEKMADTPFTNDKGKEFILPVMMVMEEADGMGRSRGASQDAIYDRILTTLLQRLDPNRCSLANKLVVVISTTNEPHMVDPAFLRRIGGSIETFGRIDQNGFVDILTKHVSGLPAKMEDNQVILATGPGSVQKKVWKAIVNEVTDSVFGDGDLGVVELHYQGQSAPVVKYRRDFLTGALIDRSVQEAATKAWEMAIGGDEEAGVTAELLHKALESQVLSVAHQLVPQNVGQYLDIPENVRVVGIKRIQTKAMANK